MGAQVVKSTPTCCISSLPYLHRKAALEASTLSELKSRHRRTLEKQSRVRTVSLPSSYFRCRYGHYVKRSIGRIVLNGRVNEDAVLLRLGLRLVILVDVLDRALPQERAWQDHHADEAARPVGRRLGEHWGRAGLIPGGARPVRGRATVGVDADAALDQAADRGPGGGAGRRSRRVGRRRCRRASAARPPAGYRAAPRV